MIPGSRHSMFGAGSSFVVGHSILTRPASSTKFTRTFGAPTDGKKWTKSSWIKRTELFASRNPQFITGKSSSTSSCQISFGVITSDDNLGHSNSGFSSRATSTQISQTTSFVHVTVNFDSTQAVDADRFKVWYGSTAISIQQLASITQNSTSEMNSAILMGLYGGDGGHGFLAAYIAEDVFVDGLALDYSYFEDGSGHPKLPVVSNYGNNGHYLTFSDNSTANALGTDYSGKGNNWTTATFVTTDQSTVVPP